MPFAYDKERVAEIIDTGTDDIESAVAVLVDRLIDHSAIRINSGCTSVYQERKRIIEAATKAAVQSVLTTDCSMLDDDLAGIYSPPVLVAAE